MSRKYTGAFPIKHLKVSSIILNHIRCLTGSQCRSNKAVRIWSNLGISNTTRAAAFKQLLSMCNLVEAFGAVQLYIILEVC